MTFASAVNSSTAELLLLLRLEPPADSAEDGQQPLLCMPQWVEGSSSSGCERDTLLLRTAVEAADTDADATRDKDFMSEEGGEEWRMSVHV
jgi:hypothetical protein